MKRNLLFLALFVAAFCLTGSAIAQDNGVPDTLYIESWDNDLGVVGNGPYFMRFPLLVTNDIVDENLDSIAGFVIPLCYTTDVSVTGGTVAYCSISSYWNQTTLNPYAPNMARSIFRDMPDNDYPEVYNRMFGMDRDFSQRGWDYIVLDLDGTSHFWLAMVPTGSQDQRWWEGSRTLLATMTFNMDFEDSFDLCIDSCFWPPSSRLAYSNSDAESYVPKIWDDYLGTEDICFRPYIIPDPPPYFDDCVDNQECYKNDHYSLESVDEFLAIDPAPFADITDLSVGFVGTGVANVEVHYDAVAVGDEVHATGYVEWDVTDHCTASGTVTLIVTDAAANKDTCEFTITGMNTPPTVTCPGNATFAYCDGFTGTAVGDDDDEDDFEYSIAGVNGIGIDTDGGITWDPGCEDVGGPYTITVTVEDECGATGECTFQLTVTNAAPTITCPASGDVVVAGKTFVSQDFVADDDCGAVVTVASIDPAATNMPDVVDNHVEWETSAEFDEAGTYEICLLITDECGLTDDCCFTVDLLKSPMVNIGPDPADPVDCAEPGELYMLPITIVSPFPMDLGGFELHIDFDYTSMTFVEARRGELIDGSLIQTEEGGYFEEFTYRLLPCPLCACCKYKILLFGMYDLPNGVDEGVAVPTGMSGELVKLFFVINSNENLRGYCIPVCWQWQVCDYEYMIDPECSENTFSDVTGNTLFTSWLLCQFDPLCCDDPGADIEQTVMFQVDADGATDCDQICFCIPVCEDPGGVECKRGDINLNYVTYEVADAVLFASYFVEGTSVFVYDVDAQICGTDVNADGRTLTLSDLVYLIRVILHDAVEIPKLAPSSEIASMIVTDGVVTAECASPIGALLFEFDGAVNPTLLANNMEMMANDGKVLVWSRNGQTIQNAEVLSFAGAELVSIEAVDSDSRTLETVITARMTPTAFALHAAYPNPFNPYVNLSFSLPEAATYSLRIYNVAGQLVRSYEGMGSQGFNSITWDGRDNSGSEVSSGVYFYKLTAAGNSATEKMVMMK
jgi:hypothetical protein